MRAVIDTNLWIAALISPSGAPAQVADAFRAQQFRLVVSEPLLQELTVVLTRPRIAEMDVSTRICEYTVIAIPVIAAH